MQLSLGLDPDPPLARVRDRLLRVFGPQRNGERHDPTSQSVKSLLSSRTHDATSQAAYERVEGSVPSWNAIPDRCPTEIVALIHDVTFAPEKAVNLVAAANAIRARRGSFDLAFLADWPPELAHSWLQRLKGVGPKTAAAIVNFSTLRKRALVVDTHCRRVATRLGLLPPKASFGRAYRGLMRLVPDEWDADDLYELHRLMKLLGQHRCTHAEPRCPGCPLHDLCACRRHPEPQHDRARRNARSDARRARPVPRAY